MSGGKQFNGEKLNNANGTLSAGGWKRGGESVLYKTTFESLKDAVREQAMHTWGKETSRQKGLQVQRL